MKLPAPYTYFILGLSSVFGNMAQNRKGKRGRTIRTTEITPAAKVKRREGKFNLRGNIPEKLVKSQALPKEIRTLIYLFC